MIFWTNEISINLCRFRGNFGVISITREILLHMEEIKASIKFSMNFWRNLREILAVEREINLAVEYFVEF